MIKITKRREALAIPDLVHKELILRDIDNYWVNDIDHPWDPESDGYLVYFEEKDKNAMFGDIPEIGIQHKYGGIYHQWMTNSGPMWEGVIAHEDELYVVTVLFNNEFAVIYYIPNRDWVDPDLLNKLEERLDP